MPKCIGLRQIPILYQTPIPAGANHKYPNKKFDEIEPDLARDYQKHQTTLPWEDAKDAARVAWDKQAGVIVPRDVSRGVRYD